MLVVREKTPDVLVLGSRPRDERIGLFLFGLGLLCLSTLFLGITQRQRYDVNWVGLMLMAQYVGPMGIVGGLVLFFQEKYVVDVKSRTVVCLRALRTPRAYSFDSIWRVRAEATMRGAGRCVLLIKNGPAVQIGAGGMNQCQELAALLSQYIPPQSLTLPGEAQQPA